MKNNIMLANFFSNNLNNSYQFPSNNINQNMKFYFRNIIHLNRSF